MKNKILIMAACACLYAGCGPEEPPVETIADSVSIAPQEESLSANGGSAEVIVTSSGAWALTGEYDWVTPSATTGGDGDVVRFTATANESTDAREAEYTFAVNDAKAVFKLTQNGGTTEQGARLELVSDASVTIAQPAGLIEILLNSDLYYRDLQYTISEEGAEWINYTVTLEGENGDISMYFSATANPDFVDRSASITISGGDKEVEVSVTQRQIDYINILTAAQIAVSLEGGAIEVPVESNVDYVVSIDESAAGWLTYNGNVSGVETFIAAATEESREAVITFSFEGISSSVTVVQLRESIISMVADMTDNWAWPLWHDNTPVTNMSTFTLEALVNANSFKSLSTIMGIEGKFLLRLGDSGIPDNQLQVVCGYTSGRTNYESKLSNAAMQLANTGVWYHIAVTFNSGNIAAYIDGELKGTLNVSQATSIDFGIPHNDETGTNITRCFWVGYAYESSRDFEGLMSEIRIWNRVLTVDELNAEDHFYQVDPASNGLVAYWKFNEGGGMTVNDHTSWGNHLTMRSEFNGVIVSLP